MICKGLLDTSLKFEELAVSVSLWSLGSDQFLCLHWTLISFPLAAWHVQQPVTCVREDCQGRGSHGAV